MTETADKNSCGFAYCFWAKFIVAIPAVPLVGYMASLLVDSTDLKMLVAAAAMIGVVGLAIKFDQLPIMGKKIVKRQ